MEFDEEMARDNGLPSCPECRSVGRFYQARSGTYGDLRILTIHELKTEEDEVEREPLKDYSWVCAQCHKEYDPEGGFGKRLTRLAKLIEDGSEFGGTVQ